LLGSGGVNSDILEGPKNHNKLNNLNEENMNTERQITFLGLTLKTIVVHTVTYFFMGLIALALLDYRSAFAEPITREYMRQVEEPIVALGPALQFIRGILFAAAFYPLREILFGRRNGWLIMWLLLVALGILSAFGAAPGSVEGLIYTTIPVNLQILGWFEVMTQALLLSLLLHYWVTHPEKKWLTWVLGIFYVLAVSASILGFIMA
jgi:hypothetical protein